MTEKFGLAALGPIEPPKTHNNGKRFLSLFSSFFSKTKKDAILGGAQEMFSDVRHFAELAAASKLSLMDDVRTLRNHSAWLP